MEGPVNFSADLTAKEKSADEVKRSLNGDLSFKGSEPYALQHRYRCSQTQLGA
jgi:hypothetical protein